MNSIGLAIRNLVRNRRRSLATLLAIAVGTTALLLFGGYVRDTNHGLQLSFVRSSGHLQLQKRGYFLYGSGNPSEYGIADYQHVMAVLRSDPVLKPMLTVVTSSLQIGGIAGNFDAGVSRTVLARGVVVDDQNRLHQWNDYGLPGSPRPMALTGTPPDSAVVGIGVARTLHLCQFVGPRDCAPPGISASVRSTQGGNASSIDEKFKSMPEYGPIDPKRGSAQMPPPTDNSIEMLAATAQGAPNVARLKVIKAETQGVKELDDIAVVMHLGQAQRLVFGGDTPKVTAIIVQLKHSAQIAAAAARIGQLLGSTLRGTDLELHDFTELNPSFGQTLAMFGAIFGFIAVMIAVIVLFTVSNTMGMTVLERTSEIGTLRALGLRRGAVLRMFVYEGAMLGAAGAIVGVVLAVVLAVALNHSGLAWTPPGRVDAVPFTVDVLSAPQAMLRALLALTFIAALSSWWPARRAARTNIVEAVRHA